MKRLERRASVLVQGIPPLQGPAGISGSSGAVGGSTLPRSTTAALEAIANAINTTDKAANKAVINETSGAIVTAAGVLAADVWENLAGATAHTPV